MKKWGGNTHGDQRVRCSWGVLGPSQMNHCYVAIAVMGPIKSLEF